MCPKAPKQPAAQLWMGGAAHSPNSTPAPTTHRHTCSAQEHVKGSILTRLHDTDRLNPPSSRPVVIQTAPVQHKTESTALRVSKGAALGTFPRLQPPPPSTPRPSQSPTGALHSWKTILKLLQVPQWN